MLDPPGPKLRVKKINTSESLRHCDDWGKFDRIVFCRMVFIEGDIESSHDSYQDNCPILRPQSEGSLSYLERSDQDLVKFETTVISS